MKKQTNFLFLLISTLSIGVFVFSVLTYTQGFQIETSSLLASVERPIGDSLVYKLLIVNSSNILSDIEKDLRSTELFDIDNDLRGVEDIFR